MELTGERWYWKIIYKKSAIDKTISHFWDQAPGILVSHRAESGTRSTHAEFS